jgi:hypothetical protein
MGEATSPSPPEATSPSPPVAEGGALHRYYNAEPSDVRVVELKSLLRIRADPSIYPNFEYADDGALPRKINVKMSDFSEARLRKGAGGLRNLLFLPADDDPREDVPMDERDGKNYVDYWLSIANEPTETYQISVMIDEHSSEDGAPGHDVTWLLEPIPPPKSASPLRDADSAPATPTEEPEGSPKKTKKKQGGGKKSNRKKK